MVILMSCSVSFRPELVKFPSLVSANSLRYGSLPENCTVALSALEVKIGYFEGLFRISVILLPEFMELLALPRFINLEYIEFLYFCHFSMQPPYIPSNAGLIKVGFVAYMALAASRSANINWYTS